MAVNTKVTSLDFADSGLTVIENLNFLLLPESCDIFQVYFICP